MNYRTLGRTGIKVSEVGLGCEGFETADQPTASAIIDTAYKHCINFIEIYSSNPDLQKRIGVALSQYNRADWVIQGHIGSTWQDGQYVRSRDVSKCAVAFENFLRNLNTDYVDLGCIHYCDEEVDYEQIFNTDFIKYVLGLKEEGKVKHISMSTHNPIIATKAVQSGLIDVILFSINPAYDMIPATDNVDVFFEKDTFNRPYQGIEPSRAELYQLCEARGVGIIVMKGFAGGLLLSADQSPFGSALTPIQCIHYCLTRPSVCSVMVGAHTESEVEISADYANATEEEKDFSKILSSAPNSSFSGHCMYCGHCAPCTSKIDVATLFKYLDLAQIQGCVPETVQGHYDLLSAHAQDCIECGRCMKNCPFGVNIIEKMRTAKRVFGK